MNQLDEKRILTLGIENAFFLDGIFMWVLYDPGPGVIWPMKACSFSLQYWLARYALEVPAKWPVLGSPGPPSFFHLGDKLLLRRACCLLVSRLSLGEIYVVFETRRYDFGASSEVIV
jgi:hypothetical protein